jgi:hypothetical protein
VPDRRSVSPWFYGSGPSLVSLQNDPQAVPGQPIPLLWGTYLRRPFGLVLVPVTEMS